MKVLHQAIGKTRTGKTLVCASNHEDISHVYTYFIDHNYSTDDILDAHALFEYLSIRAKRKQDPLLDLYAEHSHGIYELLSEEEYQEAKSRAGIVTVFDLRHLGESLASVEFKDV